MAIALWSSEHQKRKGVGSLCFATILTDRERNHDETATGALGNETTTPKARVYFSTSYYDLANRLTATVDVGTNGGSAYTRPSTVPSASDTTLVTLYGYSSAGWVNSITDPRGIVEQKSYDNLGGLTQTIEDYTNGTPTNTTNKTTQFSYDGDNHLTKSEKGVGRSGVFSGATEAKTPNPLSSCTGA
jgi:hypothetical protein